MAEVSALIAALVSPNAFAAPCSPGREDFVNYVTGGNECLAIDVWSGEALKKPGAHLLAYVHGDAAYNDRLLTKGDSNMNIKKEIADDLKNVGAVQIIRPGYKTDYNNTIPGGYPFPYEAGKYPVRYSTGKSEHGFDSYTKENIEAVMHATHRLKEHYKAKMVTMTGQSGGASMILSGAALFPQYAPDAMVLTSTSCNLKQFAIHNRTAYASPLSISPHTVIKDLPKGIKIVALNGENDEKTPPPLMQSCVDKAKAAGADITLIQPYSNHNSTSSTPEYHKVLTAILESEPSSTIVAQTPPSSPSSGFVPALQ